VLFRTRSLEGRWSGWRPAAPEDEDRPDAGSFEGRMRAGWRTGNPWWVGPSDRVETRTVGEVSRVRAYLVWSPEIRIPLRTPAAADEPAMVPRLSWGADESIRRAAPTYAPAVRFAIVHHTAGRTSYTRAEAPAIVKAIQLYHVKGNGWNDIGYNFLVDRFGTVYEGRFGGIERNVVGAHALGFNSGSTGIAVLGTYGEAAPPRAAQDALAGLIAWRLDVAHVDPVGRLTFVSGGSERFAPGIPVPLRAVSGHRDTGSTACPGGALYARLGMIAGASARLGTPKIFEPRVEASGETAMRFRARLSAPLAWAVVISSAGAEVARGTGTGSSVDWTWDSAEASSGRYSWAVTAGGARPATGSFRAGVPASALAIEEATASPAAVSPNGDGQADTTTVSFRLTAAANMTVEVADPSGLVVATAVDRVWMRPGVHTALVDTAALPDGSYNVVVRAGTATGSEVQTIVPLLVSRVLGLVSVHPLVFSPNGDGRLDELEIGFDLTVPAEVKVRIVREGRWVASPILASLEPGPQRVRWDGTRSDGRLRDGAYDAVVEASTEAGTISFGVPFASDTRAPRIRIRTLRPLQVEVSEPARLKLWVNGKIVWKEVKHAGAVRVRWAGTVRKARVVAWDAVGNVSPAVVVARRGSTRGGQ